MAASVIRFRFLATPPADRATCSMPVATPSTSAVRLSAVAAICSVDAAISLMAERGAFGGLVSSSAFRATPWIDRAICSIGRPALLDGRGQGCGVVAHPLDGRGHLAIAPRTSVAGRRHLLGLRGRPLDEAAVSSTAAAAVSVSDGVELVGVDVHLLDGRGHLVDRRCEFLGRRWRRRPLCAAVSLSDAAVWLAGWPRRPASGLASASRSSTWSVDRTSSSPRS